MNRFGKKLFTCAALAENQHRDISYRCPLSPSHSKTYRSAITDDLLKSLDFTGTLGGQVLKVGIGLTKHLGGKIDRQVERHIGDPSLALVRLVERCRISRFSQQQPNGSHGGSAGAQVDGQLGFRPLLARFQLREFPIGERKDFAVVRGILQVHMGKTDRPA